MSYCVWCGSANTKRLLAEVSYKTLPDFKRVVYVGNKCLDCGKTFLTEVE